MIVAGFGFTSKASEASLADALSRASGGRSVDAIATLSDKAGTPVFAAFAGRLGVGVVGVDAAEAALRDTATRSEASLSARGIGSVAEASALAALGRRGVLSAPRVCSNDGQATCALAVGDMS